MANRYDDVMRALGAIYAYSPRGLEAVSLSEEQMRGIESKLGHTLPEDYREFLRDYGGYSVGNAIFPVKNSPDRRSSGGIDVFHPAATVLWLYKEGTQEELDLNGPFPMEFYAGLGLVRPVEENETEFEWPSELITIGQDAGGNRTCLAVDGPNRGKPFFWYDRGNKGGQGAYIIADSFDEFIRSLTY